MMKINQTPKAEGLNKRKLYLVFGLIFGSLLVTLIWVSTRDPVEDKSNTNGSQNYALNDPNSDVSDIINAGKNNSSASKNILKTTSSTPIVIRPIVPKASDPITIKQSSNADSELNSAAMKAPLSSNQLLPGGNAKDGVGAGGAGSNTQSSATKDDSGLPQDDPNQVAEKRSFVKANSVPSANILLNSVNKPIAKLVLSMGTKIPAQIDQDINSDLPGQIYAHVSRDVYDSRTHSSLLIPAGSNLVGTYDSSIAYGQERLLVAWSRINFPNGQTLDLGGMGGADAIGAGFGDKVDNHYDRIAGATTIISILAAGAQLAQPQQTNALQAPGVAQTLGQSVGTQIAQTGTSLLQKDLNLKPTLHIRPGFECTVEVNKDIIFSTSYTANLNKN